MHDMENSRHTQRGRRIGNGKLDGDQEVEGFQHDGLKMIILLFEDSQEYSFEDSQE